jgi:hypothetical protein
LKLALDGLDIGLALAHSGDRMRLLGFVVLLVGLVVGAISICVDDDVCLQNKPYWDYDDTCANSEIWCDTVYAADMACCPVTCGTCPTTLAPTPAPVMFLFFVGSKVHIFSWDQKCIFFRGIKSLIRHLIRPSFRHASKFFFRARKGSRVSAAATALGALPRQPCGRCRDSPGSAAEAALGAAETALGAAETA